MFINLGWIRSITSIFSSKFFLIWLLEILNSGALKSLLGLFKNSFGKKNQFFLDKHINYKTQEFFHDFSIH